MKKQREREREREGERWKEIARVGLAVHPKCDPRVHGGGLARLERTQSLENSQPTPRITTKGSSRKHVPHKLQGALTNGIW